MGKPASRIGNSARLYPETMLSAQLLARGKMGVISCPVPRPGAGEVLVRVRAVGICRSDVHYFRQGKIGNQVIRKFPQLLGHEPAGEIVELGRGVRGMRPGDRVAIEPAMPCGKCAECRRGAGNTCPAVKFLGMPGQNGAFAQYMAVPAENVAKIPRAISFEIGAALEPLAVGMHAVKLAGKRMKRALVIGVGPIGLCITAVLKARGVWVEACDFLPARLSAARKMGAKSTVLFTRKASLKGMLRALSPRPDVVFEAGGTASAVSLALNAAGPGGKVMLVGITEEDAIPVNLHTARRKELTIINVRRSNGELEECINMVASGKIDLRPMITHRGKLARAHELFLLAEGYRNGVIKPVVIP